MRIGKPYEPAFLRQKLSHAYRVLSTSFRALVINTVRNFGEGRRTFELPSLTTAFEVGRWLVGQYAVEERV